MKMNCISYIHGWLLIKSLEWWVWEQISCPHYVSMWYAIVKGYWYHFCSHWMYWKLFRHACTPASTRTCKLGTERV